MKYRDMSDQKLIDLYKSCYASVYIIECFGTSDMLIMEGAARELERRGYEINDTLRVPEVTKPKKYA